MIIKFNSDQESSSTNMYPIFKRKSCEIEGSRSLEYSASLETFSRIYDALRILYQDGEYTIINGTRLLCDFPQFSNNFLEIYVNSTNQIYVNWEESNGYELIESTEKQTLLTTRKKVQACIDIVRKIQWKHFCISFKNSFNDIFVNHRMTHLISPEKEFFCYFFIATIQNPKVCLLSFKIDKEYKLWNIPLPYQGDDKPVFISDYMKLSMDTFYLDFTDFLFTKEIVSPEDIENISPNSCK